MMINKKFGMTFLALTLSLVACGQNDALPESSETQVNPLVINGTPSESGARPYQVVLLWRGIPFCGGTIISKKWILTAAHCVRGKTSISIRAGGVNIYKGDQQISVKNITIHPDYGKVRKNNNDIAILELKSDLEFKDSVSAAALPTKAIEQAHAAPGSLQIISGWGENNVDTGQTSEQLLEAPLKVMTNQTCTQELKSLGTITDQMICGATNEKAQSGCFGDSGGPFASKVNGKHVVFGIVSWGNHGCNVATVFARVSAFQKWITKTTGVQPSQAGETQPNNVQSFVERKPIGDKRLYYYPAEDQGFKHMGGNISILFNTFNKSNYVLRLERLNDSKKWESKSKLANVQPLGKINGDFPAGTYRIMIRTSKEGEGSFYQIMGSYNGE